MKRQSSVLKLSPKQSTAARTRSTPFDAALYAPTPEEAFLRFLALSMPPLGALFALRKTAAIVLVTSPSFSFHYRPKQASSVGNMSVTAASSSMPSFFFALATSLALALVNCSAYKHAQTPPLLYTRDASTAFPPRRHPCARPPIPREDVPRGVPAPEVVRRASSCSAIRDVRRRRTCDCLASSSPSARPSCARRTR